MSSDTKALHLLPWLLLCLSDVPQRIIDQGGAYDRSAYRCFPQGSRGLHRLR